MVCCVYFCISSGHVQETTKGPQKNDFEMEALRKGTGNCRQFLKKQTTKNHLRNILGFQVDFCLARNKTWNIAIQLAHLVHHSAPSKHICFDMKDPMGFQHSNYLFSGDSWMYPYQRAPMGNPYIGPI